MSEIWFKRPTVEGIRETHVGTAVEQRIRQPTQRLPKIDKIRPSRIAVRTNAQRLLQPAHLNALRDQLPDQRLRVAARALVRSG